MKKAIRNLLISGAALFAIGVVIFIIGMAAIKWDFTRLDGTEYTERSYVQADDGEQIRSVEIDMDTFGVVVKSGETVSLDYYEASNSEVSVSVDESVLKVKERGKRGGWFTHGIFNFGRMDKKFVLTIPSGVVIHTSGISAALELNGIETESIYSESTNFSVTLDDCKISTLNIRSTNTHVVTKNCELNSVDIISTNLQVSSQNSVCENFKAKSTNVTFNAADSHIDKISVDGTNERLNFNKTVSESVDVKGTNANVNFNEVEVSDSVTVNGTNTNCNLTGLKVNKLSLRGTNLNARVKVNGIKSEYFVNMDGNETTGTDPEKLLSFNGTNVKVELTFTENN